MQSMLSHRQAVASAFAPIKAWLTGPVDRIARAADVAGVLKGKDPTSRRLGRAPRRCRAPPTAALYELAERLTSWRPSRIRACFRSLNQLS